jgi:hypothetical protein
VTAVGDITSSNGKFFVVNTFGYFFGGNSNLTGWQGSNGTQIIQGFTGGSERLRITSGGVTQLKPGSGEIALEIFNGATSTGAMVGDTDNFIIGGQTGKGLVLCTNNLGQEKMRITVGGNVLIGTTTDSGGKLRVDGDIFINNSSNAQIGFNTTGALNTVGAYQYFNRSAVNKWTAGMGPADGSDNYQIVTGGVKALQLTVTTGAATFASSVTVSSSGSALGNYLRVVGSTSNNSNYPNISLVGGTLATTYPSISLTNVGLALILNNGISTEYNNPAQISLNNGVISFSTGNNAAATERMSITSGGLIYLGSDASGASGLGVMYYGGGFANQTTLDANTRFQGPNISVAAAKCYAWNTYSDQRIKENVTPLNYGLNELMQLNPVSYNQHDSEVIDGKIVLKETYKPTIGLIAQEVYDLIPESVGVGNDTELWGLDYDKIVPVLIKAIQEQQSQMESLKSENDELKSILQRNNIV